MAFSLTVLQKRARLAEVLARLAIALARARPAALASDLDRQFVYPVLVTSIFKEICALTAMSIVARATLVPKSARSALKTQIFKLTELAFARKAFS